MLVSAGFLARACRESIYMMGMGMGVRVWLSGMGCLALPISSVG